MSRKKSKNRKFLEEQVQKMLEQEKNSPSRVPVRALTGWGANTTTDPDDYQGYYPELAPGEWGNFGNAYAAAQYAKRTKSYEEAMNYTNEEREAIKELIMTVFFGLKSSREQIMQLFGDFSEYGVGHALSNIHKALDQVENLTAFEAFVFRFLKIQFNPNASDPTFNMIWKDEIFQEIDEITKKYATQIYRVFTSSRDYEDKVRSLYDQFINNAYRDVFKKHRLSDDFGPENRAEAFFSFFIGPKQVKTKVTRKPSRRTIAAAADQLIISFSQGFFKDEFGQEVDLGRSSVQDFLEKQLTRLSIPLSSGKNPTGKSIESFADMKNITLSKDNFGRRASYGNKLNKNRILAAIAIREQSVANKKFIPLAISLADVILSIVGTVSLFFGLPGFARFVVTLPTRGLALVGNRSAKEFMKKFTKRFKNSNPTSFSLGLLEFTGGLAVAFSQTVRNIENRFNRAAKFHDQYFDLLSQYEKNPESKSFYYKKQDVDSYDYTKDQLGQHLDAFGKIVFGDEEKDALPTSPDETQTVNRADFTQTLSRILGSIEDATPSNTQSLDTISPLTGSSIMQCWRDMYTLILELQMSSALYSVKPGERDRIRSSILASSGAQAQREYENFMSKIELLYKKAERNVRGGKEFSIQKRKIEEIYDNFKKTIEILQKQKSELEKENKKTSSLLNQMRKTAMPYEIKNNKKPVEINESVLSEQKIGDVENLADGHTITYIKPPAGALEGAKGPWVKLEHKDFKKELVLTAKTAKAFVKLRVDWKTEAEKDAGPLIPSNTFRPSKPGDDKGNHQSGVALDLITPKGGGEKFRLFLDHLMMLGWGAGFRGFGIPEASPAKNGDQNNFHIDMRATRWWLYDADTGKMIGSPDKWDYKLLDPTFVRRVLINEKASGLSTFGELMSEFGQASLQKHKNSKKNFKKPDTVSDIIKRESLIILKKLAVDLPRELAKEAYSEIEEYVKKSTRKPRAAVNKFFNDKKRNLGKWLTGLSKDAKVKYDKIKYLSVDAVADQRLNKVNYQDSVDAIKKVEDFGDLHDAFAADFGLTRSNVSARLGVVRQYLEMSRGSDLATYMKNKFQQFDRNILPRYKLRKLAKAKNKSENPQGVKTSKQEKPQQAQKPNPSGATPDILGQIPENASLVGRGRIPIKMGQVKTSIEFKDKINLKYGEKTFQFIFGGNWGASKQTARIDRAVRTGDKLRVTLSVKTRAFGKRQDQTYSMSNKDLFNLIQQVENIPVSKKPKKVSLGKNSGLIKRVQEQRKKDEFSPELQAILNKKGPPVSPEVEKTLSALDKGLKRQEKLATFEFSIGLKYSLLDNVIPISKEAFPKDGEFATLDDQSNQLRALKKQIRNLIYKELFRGTPNIPLKVDMPQRYNAKAEHKEGSKDITIVLYFLITTDIKTLQQILDLGEDFQDQKLKDKIAAKLNQKISNKVASDSGKLKVFGANFLSRSLRNRILKAFLKKEDRYYLKNLSTTTRDKYYLGKKEVDVENRRELSGEDGDLARREFNRFKALEIKPKDPDPKSPIVFPGREGKQYTEVESDYGVEKFTKVATVVNPTFNFDDTDLNIPQVSAPTEDDPYKVSAFDERRRLIEYIPVDMLKFTGDSIYTVTFELPGNGQEELMKLNPTVIVGRKPFDRAYAGQNESSRRALLTILKRNKSIFEKYLKKLEALPVERIKYDRYTMEDYRIYREYFQTYISLFNSGISAIENIGASETQTIAQNAYNINLMSAAMYNL